MYPPELRKSLGPLVVVFDLAWVAIALGVAAISNCGNPLDRDFPTTVCSQNQCLRRLDVNAPAPWSCDVLGQVERASIAAYEKNVTGRFREGLPDFCRRLQAFRIYFAPTKSFDYTDGLTGQHGSGYGVTRCETGVIKIGSAKPSDSALPHELGHILTNCDTVYPCDGCSDAVHAGWIEHGMQAAEGEALSHL